MVKGPWLWSVKILVLWQGHIYFTSRPCRVLTFSSLSQYFIQPTFWDHVSSGRRYASRTVFVLSRKSGLSGLKFGDGPGAVLALAVLHGEGFQQENLIHIKCTTLCTTLLHHMWCIFLLPHIDICIL